MDDKLAILGGEPIIPSDQKPPDWPILDSEVLYEFSILLQKYPLNYGSDSITRKLEEEFANYQGQKYAIGICSGSAALWAAYYSITKRLGNPLESPSSSGEVLMGGYGFWATATAALYAGLKPVFCDVEYETGNIDISSLASSINEKTVAIAVTHIDGHPADMPNIMRIAEHLDLPVIEDCSHAHGATLNGKKVGTFGDVAAFSLQTLKMLSGGEGGLLTTDHDLYFKNAGELTNVRRFEGTSISLSDFSLTGLGLKLRISPLSAALALINLRNLDFFIEQRRENLNYLTKCLSAIEGVSSPITKEGVDRGAYYEYPVKYLSQEKLSKADFLDALKAEGVVLPKSNTRAFYHLPIFSSPDLSLPVADRLEDEIFFLPVTFQDRNMIEMYVSAIEKVLRLG